MSTPILLQIATNLDLEEFKFQSADYSSYNQIILFSLLAVVVAFAGTLFYFQFRGARRKEEFSRQREQARVRLLLSEFNLGEADQEILADITGSHSPGRWIPILESRDAFEESVRGLRTEQKNAPALKHVPVLRQKLGYGFHNLEIVFNDTRMMPVGSKLHCKVPGLKEDLNYVTSIVATNEFQFLVRPPENEGAPAELKNVPTLTFRISRGDEADYEFTADFVGQARSNTAKTMALSHTREIQKYLVRNAPRTSIDLDTRFFVVKQDVAAEKSHMHFTAGESQYAFKGRLRDLSMGGGLLVIPTSNKNPEVGDIVVFRLPDAQIAEDMVARVMRLTPLGEENLQVHLRFAQMKEIARLKLSKFLEILEEQPPADAQGGEEAAGQQSAP